MLLTRALSLDRLPPARRPTAHNPAPQTRPQAVPRLTTHRRIPPSASTALVSCKPCIPFALLYSWTRSGVHVCVPSEALFVPPSPGRTRALARPAPPNPLACNSLPWRLPALPGSPPPQHPPLPQPAARSRLVELLIPARGRARTVALRRAGACMRKKVCQVPRFRRQTARGGVAIIGWQAGCAGPWIGGVGWVARARMAMMILGRTHGTTKAAQTSDFSRRIARVRWSAGEGPGCTCPRARLGPLTARAWSSSRRGEGSSAPGPGRAAGWSCAVDEGVALRGVRR